MAGANEVFHLLQVLCHAPASSGHWMGPTCSIGARLESAGAAAPPHPTATSTSDACAFTRQPLQLASSSTHVTAIITHTT
jgi:hypothetical protein